MNIVIDMLPEGMQVLPKEDLPETLVFGKFPQEWMPQTYFQSLIKVDWFLTRCFEKGYVLAEKNNFTIWIPCTALMFGIATALGKHLEVQPRIVVQEGLELIDLSEFTQSSKELFTYVGYKLTNNLVKEVIEEEPIS